MKPTLDELGIRFKTDKSSLLHGYLEHYEKLFPEPEKIKKVVELGLQRRDKKWKDASLPSVNMWLEFFPNAHIYGFDKQKLKSNDSRFTFMEGEQGRMKHHCEFGQIVGTEIDFVIDDCSHRGPDQLLSFLYFWPRIKKGGLYICEDMNAKVQFDYPVELRSHKLFKEYYNSEEMEYVYIDSRSAGPSSSLAIIKK